MGANKYNISQIRKYLNGELDARAMHKLERQAQGDPFLMDMIQGMESSDEDHQPNLDAIDRMIQERVQKDSKRVIPLYRYWPAAACLLLALGIGGWWLTRPAPKPLLAINTKIIIPPGKLKAGQPPVRLKQPVPVEKPAIAARHSLQQPAKIPAPASPLLPQPKTDATENRIADNKAKVSPGADSSATHQGQAVTKARLNGRDYAGGNLAQATQNLPAEIVEKIQVVDAYGNTAGKTGIKTDSNKQGLIATNGAVPAPVLQTAKIGSKDLMETPAAGVTTQLEGKVPGLTITRGTTDLAALRTITGKVVDGNDQPLIGAAVRVDGTTRAITTDINGAFKIAVPANDETLDVTYVGYVSRQVKVGDQARLNVTLNADQKSLSEVVVTGYGTQAKRDVTGSNASLGEAVVTGSLGRKLEEKATGYAATNSKGVNADLTDSVAGKPAHPLPGIKAYAEYLEKNAIMPDNTTGTVELGFKVGADGSIHNIRVISGPNKAMNDKAINILKNGPKWMRGTVPNETRLKVVFHK